MLGVNRSTNNDFMFDSNEAGVHLKTIPPFAEVHIIAYIFNIMLLRSKKWENLG